MQLARPRGLIAALALAALAAPAAAFADEPNSGGASPEPSTQQQQDPRPASQPAPSSSARLTRATIRAVQRKLRVRADGRIGPRTRAAIRRFQRREGLPVTGRLHPETLEALGVTPRPAAQPRTAPPAASGDLQAAIDAARSKIGAPWASGGTGPNSFDCSGLTLWAFKQAGITLPRTSFDQYGEGVAVAKADIQPGDLVFFSTAGDGASHVGIAVSATRVISTTTGGVKEHAIDDSYWGANYVGARRVTGS